MEICTVCMKKQNLFCFNYMQPQKVKFKSVQVNMKHVSYFSKQYYFILVNNFFFVDRGLNVLSRINTDRSLHLCSNLMFVVELPVWFFLKSIISYYHAYHSQGLIQDFWKRDSYV